MSDILSGPLHDWTHPLLEGAKAIGFESSFVTDEGIQGPPYTFFRDDFLSTNEVKNWTTGIYDMPHGKSHVLKPGQGTPDWDSTA